jgi:mono/diheme cytochrome c family protein
MPLRIQGLRCLLAGTVLAATAGFAAAETSEIGRGREIAEAFCGRCHAIGRAGDSPVAKAPAFRTLGSRYPVEQLAEALAEGITTGHPDMPEFTFEPDDIGALLTFLEDLAEGPPPSGRR